MNGDIVHLKDDAKSDGMRPAILAALEPRLGDERTVTRFAWLPVFVDEGYGVVWLRHYRARQVWTEPEPDGWSSVTPTWVTVARQR